MKSLLIIGAGGHGKVVAETAMSTEKWDKYAFIDEIYPKLKSVLDIPVISNSFETEEIKRSYSDVIVAIGNNKKRLQLSVQLINQGFNLVNVLHPSAIISDSAKIAQGTVIFAQSVVQANVEIGMATIINTSVTVDHDCSLGSAVHLSPGAHLGGNVVVGDESWLGLGSSVINDISIGAHVIIGAGAVVVSDIEDKVKAIGVPAKATSA